MSSSAPIATCGKKAQFRHGGLQAKQELNLVGGQKRLRLELRVGITSGVYDFGDYWDHRITVEKTHAGDPLLTLPFCIGGAGATPPEDCGGVPGYGEPVRAMADPNDPEHAQRHSAKQTAVRVAGLP